MALGNTTDVKLGDAQINKIYLGNNLVWQKNVVPIIEPILNLPFQNNFTNLTGNNTMVAGGTNNFPTFELSGRKAGEYCAVFNGSQSIKTNTNLLINSDKITIFFWGKMDNTSDGIIGELNSEWDFGSTFIIMANHSSTNFLFGDHNSEYILARILSPPIGSWNHYSLVTNRTEKTVKIYLNGILKITINTNNIGHFQNYIFFIGQRGGYSKGLYGSLMHYKMFNYEFTPTEVTNLYNSEL